MKQTYFRLPALGIALAMLIATACNDRNNETDSSPGTAKDSNLTDSRRGTTDTTNYITKDTGNQSQDVVDPEPPQNSRY